MLKQTFNQAYSQTVFTSITPCVSKTYISYLTSFKNKQIIKKYLIHRTITPCPQIHFDMESCKMKHCRHFQDPS